MHVCVKLLLVQSSYRGFIDVLNSETDAYFLSDRNDSINSGYADPYALEHHVQTAPQILETATKTVCWGGREEGREGGRGREGRKGGGREGREGRGREGGNGGGREGGNGGGRWGGKDRGIYESKE